MHISNTNVFSFISLVHMSLYNKPVMLLCEIVLHMIVAVILLAGVSVNVSLWLSAVIFVKNTYLEISWNPYFPFAGLCVK
jgi:uncharacterized protein (DUF983 family)